MVLVRVSPDIDNASVVDGDGIILNLTTKKGQVATVVLAKPFPDLLRTKIFFFFFFFGVYP